VIDVILPARDEAAAIPWVLDRMPSGFRPIVVDNGSRDGSGGVARAHGATVVEAAQAGFGAACFAGLCRAEAELVCFMDCDGSLDPRELPSVVGPVRSGAADMVLGARRAERGAWPSHARLANRLIARRLNRRCGLRLSDLGPMRAMRRTAVLDLAISDRRSGWPLEMVVLAARAGWRIDEVPVAYRRRRGGRSKVTGSVRGTLRAAADMSRVAP
jgi:glycosyltransferase involved in cell wall biosynthesis